MDTRFTPLLISAAQVAQARYRVPSSVTLAQWALESAYGTHMPAGSNNPFGIKAKPGEPSVAAKTWEVINGVNERVTQNFRKFGSITEAFEAHGDLLNKPIYADAIGEWTSGKSTALSEGVTAMAAHYATDPNYDRKLMQIITNNNLSQFDHELPAKPVAAPVAAAPQVSAATVTEKTNVEKMMMSTGLAGSMLSALMTYGPKVASLASHGIANSADVKKKGADMVQRLVSFDVPDALVDFNAILADFGVTASQASDAVKASVVNPPPQPAASDPISSVLDTIGKAL